MVSDNVLAKNQVDAYYCVYLQYVVAFKQEIVLSRNVVCFQKAKCVAFYCKALRFYTMESIEKHRLLQLNAVVCHYMQKVIIIEVKRKKNNFWPPRWRSLSELHWYNSRQQE